ncbi:MULTISPECIES: TadE/TadG family type IV pilus assembly protein [Myxococcus]|uniref:TadE/TadG family type IV pilus assembly protein n=1 Tax=Myxococcus TaxID=32 RepID=UPI00112B1CD1|nr:MULTISPECIES: TadE/TadG family type IV pilus assembly protein [Myxococcus]QDE80787.1 pilus assembly protein TadE [Myxococcus xanthus]QDE95107.1 pilus assembly protein TadE [Myxococcus xanthus]WAM27317.1 pilus assembly protein [Myxococcus sp. NMCA1]
MKPHTSSRLTRRRSRARRGAATVEFALLAPLLVVLVLWSNYFWDLQRVRLKGAELARYVAFERTVKTDVDGIAAEAQERYKDLDGSTKTGSLDSTFEGRFTVAVRARNADAPLTSSSMSGRSSGGLMAAANTAMSVLGGTVDAVARQMGLDSRQGAIQTDVELTIRNGFIPETLALYTTGFGNGRLDMRMTERFYLFHDTWRAWGPGDMPGSSSYPRVEQRTYDRVRRIAYAGVSANSGGVLDSIGDVLQVLGLDFPFSNDYLRDSVRILRVTQQPTPRLQLPTQMRTVPGDVLQAAYWRNDTRWCFGNCEPNAVQQKRGFSQNGGYGDNWPMRAYNCRGPYFQGASKSELPESVYSDAYIFSVKREQYHHYDGNACQ